MDFYLNMLSPGMQAHLEAYWFFYAAGLAVAIVVIAVTRKYSVPILAWVAEYVVYCGLFHAFLGGVVRFFAWFRDNTQMEWREEYKEVTTWQTPWTAFWNRQLYEPQWLFWVEVGFAVLILAAMIRYKPMKVQKIGPKREVIHKGGKPRYVPKKPGARPGPPPSSSSGRKGNWR